MAAITTISFNPSSKFLRTSLVKPGSLNRTSFTDTLSSSRSIFCGGFVIKEAICGTSRLWVPNSMDELTRTSAFRDRDRDSDEGVRVLEQEAFIDGSNKFQSKFVFRDVEATLNKLSKWIVAGLFGAVILCRHDAEGLWFAAGSVLNAMLSLALKQILNQERPSALKSDPGMPSSHAQSIFFTVMFAVLSSIEWLGINGLTITTSALAFGLGSYFTYLRVSQQLHTVSQVLVGAAIGSIYSILWYWSWNSFVLNAFMSSLLVRIIVVLGSIGICLGFVVYVIRYWLREE
ncbi:hypothetical protein L6164_027692 [Bauhinia variegata]|uniref:Uncharacterized protein n=1 Tax=Bauhinia variegata TaxID=167791 RepID=A0ACB9LVC5_BAUVA|nr:hypothetical protein L6164_027692 [Bauhinia variegata]